MKKILFLIFLSFILIGCAAQHPDSESSIILPVEVLKPVQVDEYEGEKLSSVNDFRENSIKGPQYINIDDYSLEITGLVENQLSLSYDEVIARESYSKTVTLNCVEGWSVRILWEGVFVKDLLELAGPLNTANTVIFHAYDGYTTSFPLDYFMDNDIIMAFKMNGMTLMPERGFPFQLVAESKWGYKWIKWITKIELSDDESYEGYWEKRGYSNTGNLGERFLD